MSGNYYFFIIITLLEAEYTDFMFLFFLLINLGRQLLYNSYTILRIY